MKVLYVFALVVSVSLAQACKNAAPKTPPTTEKIVPPTPSIAADTTAKKTDAPWLVVNVKGEATLFGEFIDLNKLPDLLADTLSKITPVPNDIPIKFDGEILMGMRGNVHGAVQEGIEKAKLHKVLMSDKAEDMAKNFYVWYMNRINGTSDYVLIQEKNDAEAVLTPDLLKFLQKANKKEGGLGMDYFLQAQDWGEDWGTVSVLNTQLDGSKAVCTVQLGNGKGGKDAMAAQKLRVTMVDKKAGWRIHKVETAR